MLDSIHETVPIHGGRAPRWVSSVQYTHACSRGWLPPTRRGESCSCGQCGSAGWQEYPPQGSHGIWGVVGGRAAPPPPLSSPACLLALHSPHPWVRWWQLLLHRAVAKAYGHPALVPSIHHPELLGKLEPVSYGWLILNLCSFVTDACSVL